MYGVQPDPANIHEAKAAIRPQGQLIPAGSDVKRSFRRDTTRAFWFAIGNTPAGKIVLPYQMKRALAKTRTRNGCFALSYPLARWGLGDGLITEIEPGRIKTWLLSFATSGGDLVVLRDFFIGGGDWSALLRDVEASPVHQEIAELIANDLDFETCPSYCRLIDRLAAEGPFVKNYIRLASRKDIQAYFQHYAALVESIRAQGFVRKADRAGARGKGTVGGLRSKYHEMIETDVGVAIDRDGRLHRFRGGFHRAAIAKCLGLERMPVAVKLVHAEWLNHVIAETGLPPHQAVIAGIRSL